MESGAIHATSFACTLNSLARALLVRFACLLDWQFGRHIRWDVPSIFIFKILMIATFCILFHKRRDKEKMHRSGFSLERLLFLHHFIFHVPNFQICSRFDCRVGNQDRYFDGFRFFPTDNNFNIFLRKILNSTNIFSRLKYCYIL